MVQTEPTSTNVNQEPTVPLGEVVRLVLFVLVWFLLQSSHYYEIASGAPFFLAIGFHGTALLPLSGIAGSAGFVLMHRAVPDKAAVRPRLACILVASLVGLNAATLASLPVLVTLFFLCAASLVTILFLEECAAISSRDIRFILWSFFFLAVAVPFEIAFTLLPLEPQAFVVASGLLQLALVALYAFSLRRLPRPVLALITKSSAYRILLDEVKAQGDGLTETQEPADTESNRHRLPWQLMVHILLFYFVILLIWTVVGKEELPLPAGCVALASGIVTLAAFYLAFVLKDGYLHYWLKTRQITLPLAVAALPLFALGPWGKLAALFLIQAAYRFFLLSSYVEVFFICKNTFIGNRNALAGVHVVMYVGMVAGISVGSHVAPALTCGDPAACYAIILATDMLLILASCWLGDDKRAAKVWGRRIELTPKGRQDIITAQAVDLVAQRYGLTPKETETLSHVVQGKNVELIAEELYVSVNTIRTHIRGIYSKLDVHSRAEVCRVFEAARKEL